MQNTVMTVAVVRSDESDVTSVGGGGTTGVETLQKCQIPHNRREHMEVPNMHQVYSKPLILLSCYSSLFTAWL